MNLFIRKKQVEVDNLTNLYQEIEKKISFPEDGSYVPEYEDVSHEREKIISRAKILVSFNDDGSRYGLCGMEAGHYLTKILEDDSGYFDEDISALLVKAKFYFGSDELSSAYARIEKNLKEIQARYNFYRENPDHSYYNSWRFSEVLREIDRMIYDANSLNKISDRSKRHLSSILRNLEEEQDGLRMTKKDVLTFKEEFIKHIEKIKNGE